jgi:hypothetical protein
MTDGGTLEEKKYFVLASRWKNCINKERKSISKNIMLQDHDVTSRCNDASTNRASNSKNSGNNMGGSKRMNKDNEHGRQ